MPIFKPQIHFNKLPSLWEGLGVGSWEGLGVGFLLFLLFSCNRTPSGIGTADSTAIRNIIEMQHRGDNLRNSSQFEDAIATHDSCIRMAEDIADTFQLIIALNNQGTNLRRINALSEASDCHYRALSLCDEYSDTASYDSKKNRVRSLNGLGNILMAVGNNDAAEEMLRKALEGETKLGSATGQAINLANIGSIRLDKGQRDSARIYYNRSMEKNLEANNKIGICLCYTYLGNLDKMAHNMSSAIGNFRKSYQVGNTTGDVWHWLNPCIELASIFIELHEPDSAAKYIEIGMAAATRINSHEHLAKLYGVRSLLEEQRMQTGLALRDLQMSRNINDSLVSAEDGAHIQNLRVKYTINRSAVEVKQAEEKAKMSRIVRDVVIVSAVIIFILLGSIFLMYRRSNNARRKSIKEREVFYRNVTHQLRTPMTVVMGMVEQLKEHIPENDIKGRESLMAAQRQSHNLLDLIKKLIDASKEGLLDEHILSTEGELVPTNQVIAETKKKNKAIEVSSKIISERTRKTILVAEDNDDVALLITNLLQNNGYVAMRVVDGKEAWDALQGELPDMLITDIAMPRIDGLELIRRVRADDTMSHMPVIVVSARVEDHERLEGISAGAEVYLAKPFIPEELLLRVKKVIEQRERLIQRFASGTLAEKDTEDITDKENQFINTLNSLIEKNMSTGDVNTTFIADKMCMSVSTLNRKVKNVTGMPTNVYIRTRRLLTAMRLLKTTDRPISDIEKACGFNTPGHFSRLFKAETGMSPSEYRQ